MRPKNSKVERVRLLTVEFEFLKSRNVQIYRYRDLCVCKYIFNLYTLLLQAVNFSRVAKRRKGGEKNGNG